MQAQHADAKMMKATLTAKNDERPVTGRGCGSGKTWPAMLAAGGTGVRHAVAQRHSLPPSFLHPAHVALFADTFLPSRSQNAQFAGHLDHVRPQEKPCGFRSLAASSLFYVVIHHQARISP